MRTDVEFDAEGATLRGWLYVPDGATGPVPTIVMAHGFSAVKEMYLDRFAEAFAAAGLGALGLRQPQLRRQRRRAAAGDRPLGAGARLPRRDHLRHDAAEVDADRIGIWGSSYSGGHVLVVGAIDRRVKCVACQVPLISGHRNARRIVRSDFIAVVGAMFDEDRASRYAGKPPGDDPGRSTKTRWRPRPCRPPTPTPGSPRRPRPRAPSWRNEVTLRSVEMFWEYEPGAYIQWVSPTPLQMVVAAKRPPDGVATSRSRPTNRPSSRRSS